MGDLFPLLGDNWFWFVVGLALLIGKLRTGIFLLWLAIAAGLTGFVNAAYNISWRVNLLFCSSFHHPVMASCDMCGVAQPKRP